MSGFILFTLVLAISSAEQDASKTLTGHDHGVWSVAFSPDGKILASGGGDTNIRLWDVATGKETAVLKGHKGRPQFLSWSKDGHRLASASNELGGGGAKLWDVDQQKELQGWDEKISGFDSVAMDPAGKYVTAGNSFGAIVWDSATGAEIRRLPGHAECLALSPDGKVLAMGYEDQVSLVNTETWTTLRSLTKAPDPIQRIAYGSDGKTIISGARGGTIATWDPTTGKMVTSIKVQSNSIGAIDFGPTAKVVAVNNGLSIDLWDLQRGKKLQSLSGHKDVIICIAFSPAGQWMASGGADTALKLWKLR